MSDAPAESSALPDAPSHPGHRPVPAWKQALLWFVAFLLAASAILYQRATGPTYPYKGTFEVGGTAYKHKLLRSHETTEGAALHLPSIEGDFTAVLHQKRFKTDDPFTPSLFVPEPSVDRPSASADWVARLERQPAAGKMEYFVTIHRGTADSAEAASALPVEARIPSSQEENIVLRYKDPVPATVLLPHVVAMTLAIMIGMRAALAALVAPAGMRIWSWSVLVCITVGGMMLGPLVQKYAFGAYWTGFPWGMDLTDNKTLIMWIGWLVACAAIGFKPKRKEVVSRALVLAAALVMTGVYLIPHSMQGSELDYEKLEQGVDAHDAIGTGN